MCRLRALGVAVLVQAVLLYAFNVKVERVGVNSESTLLGDLSLTALNLLINELFDAPTVDAYQMVVVVTDLLFENGFA